jgi:hypothetical protein
MLPILKHVNITVLLIRIKIEHMCPFCQTLAVSASAPNQSGLTDFPNASLHAFQLLPDSFGSVMPASIAG